MVGKTAGVTGENKEIDTCRTVQCGLEGEQHSYSIPSVDEPPDNLWCAKAAKTTRPSFKWWSKKGF